MKNKWQKHDLKNLFWIKQIFMNLHEFWYNQHKNTRSIWLLWKRLFLSWGTVTKSIKNISTEVLVLVFDDSRILWRHNILDFITRKARYGLKYCISIKQISSIFNTTKLLQKERMIFLLCTNHPLSTVRLSYRSWQSL